LIRGGLAFGTGVRPAILFIASRLPDLDVASPYCFVFAAMIRLTGMLGLHATPVPSRPGQCPPVAIHSSTGLPTVRALASSVFSAM